MQHGKFILSLDFELLWGVRDKKTIAQYGDNIKNVHQIFPEIIHSCDAYGVKTTVATVGMLFFDDKSALLNHLPNSKPTYDDSNLSPYTQHIDAVLNKETAVYHFAKDWLLTLKKNKNHEISTHTFSHYYTMEPGQTKEQFEADIKQAIHIGQLHHIPTTSIIFPRNQFNPEYTEVLLQNGITNYRGNEESWLYKSTTNTNQGLFKRALRLMDAYLNISGRNCYSDAFMKSQPLINIPSSRLLRAYHPKLSILDGLKMKRIKDDMTHAAKNNLCYHLWFHPHNFGSHSSENLQFLTAILKHYQYLNIQYQFSSYTMTELATKLQNNHA